MYTIKDIQDYLKFMENNQVCWDKLKEAQKIQDINVFISFFKKYHSNLVFNLLFNPNNQDAALYISSKEPWVLYTIEWKFRHGGNIM